MATEERVERAGLDVSARLADFIEKEALQDLQIPADRLWAGIRQLLSRFSNRNEHLLQVRRELQGKIDSWHRRNPGRPEPGPYLGFLGEIGYLQEETAPVAIETGPVDREIALLAGPQLVVPATNPRFLLNAVNARWGSLYDALYGTDAIAPLPADRAYDPARGAKVVGWSKAFLDRCFPLARGSWFDYAGGPPLLADPAQLVTWSAELLLLRRHGLHVELRIDPRHPVGQTDRAGISDIQLEAALTTILDLEDSVATVDVDDKICCYQNLLRLLRGTLTATFEKNGATQVRGLAADRAYVLPDGSPYRVPGRSLMLIRNVGSLMKTDAIRMPGGFAIADCLLDAVVTCLIAMHDLRRGDDGRNSRTGSIYIVKPKMHGPDEAAFCNDLFEAVEDLLGLPRHSVKIGLMDEERRTSANLGACVQALRHRLVFINTGFLDRTGDEIHTSRLAGPMLRKRDMRTTAWIGAYEDRNVQIGLASGLGGRGQIGKGMWAAPDRMRDMLASKGAHPAAGASTAWVPNPSTAVLHATHYHEVDVRAVQRRRLAEAIRPRAELLTPPLLATELSAAEIQDELENNIQGILGYVVRWVEMGIGCSKVPDINNILLMEDCATLRISSQHIANWLLHGLVTRQQVEDTLRGMAGKVDQQNAGDPDYIPMAGNEDGAAFQAARALIFEGSSQPNGYTEPLLYHYRRIEKERLKNII